MFWLAQLSKTGLAIWIHVIRSISFRWSFHWGWVHVFLFVNMKYWWSKWSILLQEALDWVLGVWLSVCVFVVVPVNAWLRMSIPQNPQRSHMHGWAPGSRPNVTHSSSQGSIRSEIFSHHRGLSWKRPAVKIQIKWPPSSHDLDPLPRICCYLVTATCFHMSIVTWSIDVFLTTTFFLLIWLIYTKQRSLFTVQTKLQTHSLD